MSNSTGDLQKKGLLLSAKRFLAPIYPERHFHACSPAPLGLAQPCPQSPFSNFISQLGEAASPGESYLQEHAATKGLGGGAFLTLTSVQGKCIFIQMDLGVTQGRYCT